MNENRLLENSALFKFKNWLPVADAASYLTKIFEESVRHEDVLRMGLDGHLQLSVYFPNGAKAIVGKISSTLTLNEIKDNRKACTDTGLVYYPPGTADDNIKTKKAIWDSEIVFKGDTNNVTLITGVWDLPMIGNERYDVENEYQRIIGGPEVSKECFEGVLVQSQDDVICQLQEKAPPQEYEDQDGNISMRGGFYPAYTLPQNSLIVIRTQALVELQTRKLSSYQPGHEQRCIVLDTEHAFHAKELRIAIESWMELYEKNPPQHVPQGGHKNYISKWLVENHPGLSQRARDRITTIVNPNPKGGASPTE